jgi:hypothetical protein
MPIDEVGGGAVVLNKKVDFSLDGGVGFFISSKSVRDLRLIGVGFANSWQVSFVGI